MSPAQVPMTGWSFPKLMSGSRKSKESINNDRAVDSPPGMTSPSTDSKSSGTFTGIDSILSLEKTR